MMGTHLPPDSAYQWNTFHCYSVLTALNTGTCAHRREIHEVVRGGGVGCIWRDKVDSRESTSDFQ
jgi:hypothetical protein